MPTKTIPNAVECVWPKLHALASHAAYDGDLSDLRGELQDGMDISSLAHTHNCTDATVLHTAVTGSVELVDLVLSHGAALMLEARVGPGEDGRWAGQTPLQMAARLGQHGIANRLLSIGAHYDIFSAAALGDTHRIVSMMQDDARIIQHRDEYNATPLHWAADQNQRAAIEVLLQHGADKSARDDFDETPLLVAARREAAVETVQRVARNLRVAVEINTVVDALMNAPHTLDIYEAAALNDIDQVRELLDSKPRLVNAANRHGTTPLHWAAMNGHCDIAEMLLQNGAQVDAKDKIGCPPLWYAAYWAADATMAQLLCRHGADTEFKNIWDKDIFCYDCGTAIAAVIQSARQGDR